MRIYRTAFKQYHYLGQCDKLRCDSSGENNWQQMMQLHQKVSIDEFLSRCDISLLINEDMNKRQWLEEWISDASTSYFAKSKMGNPGLLLYYDKRI